MPTVCVVGPRDHGKSTLVRRLRGLPDLGQRYPTGLYLVQVQVDAKRHGLRLAIER